jgi:hypothetical protein
MNDKQRTAVAEFQRASDQAGRLAEEIGKAGRSGASYVEMVHLLKAWQDARNEARLMHDRMLFAERPVAFDDLFTR